MTEPNLTPEDISSDDLTFEQAIALTQSLLTQMEQGKLSEAEIGEAIATLVSSMNGARGFFVTYLSDERAIADHPSEAVMQALQTSPEIVSDLLVKNLAMSSAMAITHRRNGDEPMAQGSDRVRSRTAYLIKRLRLAAIIEKAQKLHESASTGLGEYKAFLDRWGYDAEQRQVIQQSMEGAIGLAVDDSVSE
jgi:hypothetical protein